MSQYLLNKDKIKDLYIWYNCKMQKLNIGQYTEKYRKIRKGNENKILFEGIHAWKHAYRFEAEFEEILISDIQQIEEMPENVLGEDEKKYLFENAIQVDEEFFDKLIPYKTRSKVLAIAKKPTYKIEEISEDKPIVFLENPANPENIGMVLRISAAFGVGALVSSGRNNPFTASVLRAGAGLIYAVPTFHMEFSELKEKLKNRKIIVADAEGKSIKKNIIPKNSIIIFGTEREGVSQELKDLADKIFKLDMQLNVSSLNLATSVSAFLYGGEFI